MKNNILQRNTRYSDRVNALFSELEKYDDATLNRTPKDGGWSAIQTLHHLILTEELSMAYIQKKLSFNPQLESVGFGVRWRGFLLWTYLNTPLKFKAPKNVGDENLPAQVSFAETRARWQKARDAWNNFLEKMPDEMADKTVYKHPRAGRLGWAQMFSFFETHLERHTGQIHRAVK